MKFLLTTVLICSAFLFILASADQPSQSKIDSAILKNSDLSSSESVRVIVWIDRSEYQKSKSSKALSLGKEKIKYEYDIIPALAMEIPANRLESFSRQNFVKRIEPVLQVKAFLQDSVPLINASKVWDEQILGANITGKNIGVCILDTGVNYTHADLGGCFGSGCKVVAGYDYVNSDSDPMDDHGHGTHVAGIAAANGGIKGVAPNASIIAIKVLDASGAGYSNDIIAGIEWCTNNKAAYNISVISMSLGGSINYASYCDNESGITGLRDAINAAVGRNITVVAATGNDGNTTGIAAPACVQNATAIASSTKADEISGFSNRNNITDLVAPSSSINSTKIDGGYLQASGTSMATPHAAGAFTLLYQKYRLINGFEPTPAYLQNILNSTGIKINDTAGNKLNFSRIDVYAASLQLNDSVPPKWDNQSSNANQIGLNGTVLLTAYWTDNALLSYALLSTNETGAWQNKSSLALSGSAAWSNFSWSNYSITNDTVIGWRIFANDTSGNQNVTAVAAFMIADAPRYFNETNSPDNTYAPGKTYWFNISWTDNTAIDKVIFEWNGTNDTVLNSTQDNFYSINRTDLLAGNYTYRWIANDTSGNQNYTASLSYTVTQSTTSVRLWFNDTENNKTYFRGAVANITAQVNVSILNVNISANFTGMQSDINSSVSTAFAAASLLNISLYNITAYTQGNQNYSASHKTYFIFVRNLFSNNSINITANNSVLVNASAVNISIIIVTNGSMNASINISVGIDNPTGATLPQGLNKFIAIETENITSNLTYAILNVSYADVSVSPSIDNSSLRLYRWNDSYWTRLEGGVETALQYIWANLTQFSNFTIGGLLANGQSCTSESQCSGGYCVHGYCRSSSTYCGDSFCDAGESCSADSSACGSGYACTSGCASTSTSSSGSSGSSGYVAPQNKTQNVTANKTVANETRKEDKGFRVCAQVITPAVSPLGECKEFPTPCDVPENWTKVESCPSEEKPKEQKQNYIAVIIGSIIILSAAYLYMKYAKSMRKPKAQKEALKNFKYPIYQIIAMPVSRAIAFWIVGSICVFLGTMVAGAVEPSAIGATWWSILIAYIIAFVLILIGGMFWISVATTQEE